jgi:hypothetical protein
VSAQRSAARDLPRERARFVAEAVERWRSESFAAKAAKRCQSLPVQVRAQGLTIAVALLLRGEREDRAVADLLATWLLREAPARTLQAADTPSARALLRAVTQADRASYLGAQHEALRLLDQLKLLSDALIGVHDG